MTSTTKIGIALGLVLVIGGLVSFTGWHFDSYFSGEGASDSAMPASSDGNSMPISNSLSLTALKVRQHGVEEERRPTRAPIAVMHLNAIQEGPGFPKAGWAPTQAAVPDDAQRALVARRIDLASRDQLGDFIRDPCPEVRIAAVERARELESDYEEQYGVERRSDQSGQFVTLVLNALNQEADPFFIRSSLAYLAEYSGRDGATKDGLIALLDHADLDVQTLADISEQLIEGQSMESGEAIEIVRASPSVDQLAPSLQQELDGKLLEYESSQEPSEP